jgi:hypothetical protein
MQAIFVKAVTIISSGYLPAKVRINMKTHEILLNYFKVVFQCRAPFHSADFNPVGAFSTLNISIKNLICLNKMA